jgi:hypothetical protein
LHELADGQLDRPAAEAVRAHLAGCPACALAHRDVSRLKGLVLAKFQKPSAPEPLASSLLGRVHAGRSIRWTTAALAAGLVATAAAATIVVFLRMQTPRLSHADVASGCREAFFAAEALPDGQGAASWRKGVLKEICRETGLKVGCLPDIPNTTYLGWERVTVKKVTGVRIDLKPGSPATAKEPGKPCADNARISVFILPLRNMDFCCHYLKELESGHGCTTCIEMKDGSIFCYRNADCIVQVLSNLEPAEFMRDHLPEWRGK